jgi:hypothetical protein
VPAYSIAQGDVVDLAGKTSRQVGAAQQLRDCLRAGLHTGQFVSGGRNANLISASWMPNASV